MRPGAETPPLHCLYFPLISEIEEETRRQHSGERETDADSVPSPVSTLQSASTRRRLERGARGGLDYEMKDPRQMSRECYVHALAETAKPLPQGARALTRRRRHCMEHAVSSPTHAFGMSHSSTSLRLHNQTAELFRIFRRV
mmetsp:Transcript_56182/g.110019  ORF Transcript_56182/g.110019 Transcript_56182/m.110019 type:complete len:142 (+) Transcript_56182:651-1076(+)